MIKILPIQLPFRQELPNVSGNLEYIKYRDRLQRMDEIIDVLKLEHIVMRHFIKVALKNKKEIANKKGTDASKCFLSEPEQMRAQKNALAAIRCCIARHITGESYRNFSCHLADSAVLQNFCCIDRLDEIKVPGKSALCDYEKKIPEEVIRKLVETINKTTAVESEKLNLEKKVSFEKVYIDSTCLKANIHFPVDWILLRDAVRTLMKALLLIRREGLKNRMDSPKKFMTSINKLAIEMTNQRRKKTAKRERKRVFRLMKKLMKKITVHAQRHLELLENNWSKTKLSLKQMMQIKKRLDNILLQLPTAVFQAQERIIGGRLIKSKDKILSLYEKNIHVIVRGKASSEVEFGNTLLIAEQENGLLIDWKIYKDQAPSDSKLLVKSIERIKKYGNKCEIKDITTDRGFHSAANEKYLKNEKINDHQCPRTPSKLIEKLKDEKFRKNQTRRAQTEGRIAIVKNIFIGNPMRSKGFANRKRQVAWGVLVHNLWLVARMEKASLKKKNA